MKFRRAQFLVGVGFLAIMSAIRANDFFVTNPKASGPGSFAQAINDANNHAGSDRILFNIPGTGVRRIDLSGGELPPVTDGVLIDGYSQPGASANTLAVGDNAKILIWLDCGGAAENGFNGLTISAPDCTIQGLSITGCRTQSLYFHGFFQGGSAVYATRPNCVVQGNFLGLKPDATAESNNTAIWFAAGGQNGIAGGTTPAARNLISGCTGNAIVINSYAKVLGNYIGTDPSGTKAIPNNVGILIAGNSSPPAYSPIGGIETGAGNLISGNANAISIGAIPPDSYSAVPGYYAQIKGNLIGVQADGITPLPNQSSIVIIAGDSNTIGGMEVGAGNVIAFNGEGVLVATTGVGAYQNSILSNSIYENLGPQIDLGGDGSTRNDNLDADDGPNHFPNYPVLTSFMQTSQTFTLGGTLTSTPNTQFTIQFFSEAPSSNEPEQIYLGSTSITTDGNGDATFSGSFPLRSQPSANPIFNATATNSAGETSEFSPDEFPAPAQVKNISTRADALAGDHAMIGGFILSSDRTVVLRALGPSLANNNLAANQCLADPTLQLFDSKGTLLSLNDDWRSDSAATRLQLLQLAPADDSESAMLRDLSQGAYTTLLSGKDNLTGLALLEVYVLNSAGSGQPLNLSTRGFVGTGDDVLIGGFIVVAPGTTRIVARGIGPSLTNAGVPDALVDPTLELHDASGTLIRSDDDWRDTQQTEIANTMLAPANAKEAAIYATLPAGNYTAIVAGKNGATGVALVEIYNLL